MVGGMGEMMILKWGVDAPLKTKYEPWLGHFPGTLLNIWEFCHWQNWENCIYHPILAFPAPGDQNHPADQIHPLDTKINMDK